MKIAIGSDHAGYEVKQKLLGVIAAEGHEAADKGTDSEESCDYPDYAKAVSEAVVSGECEMGILVCGTGLGMSMAANKVKGIRAAKACSVYEAEMSRMHNDANVLCIGARSTDYHELIVPMVRAWLSTEFEGGRHERRVNKIMELEK